ncbi:MFS transporter [Streptomyces albogriseolus]|nr:MFS transporter [Streptomyces albogriseolus]
MGRTGARPAPAPAAPAPGYRAVLRAPGLRAVFAAHAVSMAGKLAAEVALSILVHQRTGSPLLSSLVLVCAFAPHAVGGTALSALADRFPPRRVLAGCDLLAAACVAAMLLPGLPVAALLLLLLGTGLVAPVAQGARAAILTQLLDDGLFPVGRSLLRTVSQTAVVTGFALGGVLVAAVGPYPTLAADAVSLLVSAALAGLCTPATPALAPDGRRSPAGVLADSADGLRRLFADREVRRLVLLTWAVPGFSAVGDGLAVAYTAQAGAPATAAGALFTGYAAGTVLGETAVARLAPARRRRLVVPLLVCSQAPLAAFLLGPPVPGGGGAAGSLRGGFACNQGIDPLILAATEPACRGRLFTVQTSGMMTVQGAAIALSGAAGTVVAPGLVIGASGVAGTAVVVILFVRARG